jgi:arsenite methyltransferase
MANDIKETVKTKYGQAALRVVSGDGACCGTGAGRREDNPITSNLYEAGEIADVPADAVAASMGCGNPTALAQLEPARSCWTSGRAAASTSCCRPGASAPPARRTGST